MLPGDVAFTLHDTHGFPVELTEELARDAGVEVDRAGFDAAMAEQRARARAAARSTRAGDEAAYRALLEAEGPTAFVGRGRENYEVPAQVVAVLEGDGDEEGATYEVFLDRTPFYADGGGQVGDTGTIVTESGIAVVSDTVFAVPGLVAHRARVDGELRAGQDALATIDGERREATRRNHTATHLLHSALRSVLGRARTPAGLARGTGLPAFRLLTPRAAHPRAARRGVRAGQRRRADRRGRRDDRDLPRGGRADGRHRLLRRQVRLLGARGARRAGIARVLRRHPRRLARPDRPHHAALGGLHRLEHAAHLRRHGARLPRPRPVPRAARAGGVGAVAQRTGRVAGGHRPRAGAPARSREGTGPSAPAVERRRGQDAGGIGGGRRGRRRGPPGQRRPQGARDAGPGRAAPRRRARGGARRLARREQGGHRGSDRAETRTPPSWCSALGAIVGGGGGGSPEVARAGGKDPAQIEAALAEAQRLLSA